MPRHTYIGKPGVESHVDKTKGVSQEHAVEYLAGGKVIFWKKLEQKVRKTALLQLTKPGKEKGPIEPQRMRGFSRD